MNAGKPHMIQTGRLWDYLEMIETQMPIVVVENIMKNFPRKKDPKGVQSIDWDRVNQNWPLAVELRENPDPAAWLMKAMLADIDIWYATLQFWRKKAIDAGCNKVRN